MNKKAQGMSTNTIILLILGLIVLIALIWGFATGWSAFQGLIGSSNVDDIVRDCSSACAVNGMYSFCSADRTLKASEDNFEITTSCKVLANEASLGKYGIQDCPTITCTLTCADVKINGFGSGDVGAPGTYDVSTIVTDASCTI